MKEIQPKKLDDIGAIHDEMLTSDADDDHYKMNMPIDLGNAPGSYGITVNADADFDFNAVADPGGISPEYELKQMKDNIGKANSSPKGAH